MLWTIIIILLILWLLGFFGGRAWNNNGRMAEAGSIP